MDVQVTAQRELFVARGTGEARALRVDADVTLQVGQARERLVATVAPVLAVAAAAIGGDGALFDGSVHDVADLVWHGVGCFLCLRQGNFGRLGRRRRRRLLLTLQFLLVVVDLIALFHFVAVDVYLGVTVDVDLGVIVNVDLGVIVDVDLGVTIDVRRRVLGRFAGRRHYHGSFSGGDVDAFSVVAVQVVLQLGAEEEFELTARTVVRSRRQSVLEHVTLQIDRPLEKSSIF